MTMITEENIDEYLLLYTDGELSAADEQALLAWLELHPEHKNDLAAYRATVQKPAVMAFPGKKALIKKEAASARVIAFKGWMRYGLAAGIAALLMITFLSVHREKEVAAVPTKPSSDSLRSNATKPASTSVTPLVNSIVATDSLSERALIAPVRKQQRTIKQTTELASKYKPGSPQQEGPLTHQPRREKDSVSHLEIATITELPSTSAEPMAYPPVTVGTEGGIERKQSLLDRLPIDDTKKEGMETLAENITDRFQRVNALKKKLDEKNISVRVQKRKLIISF